MRKFLTGICLVAVLAAPLSARKWTSRDGKYSTEAELVDYQDNMVILKRDSDGKVLRLPLSKLGLADVKYVSDALKATGRDLKPTPPPTTSTIPSGTKANPKPAATERSTRSRPRPTSQGDSWQVLADPSTTPLEFDAGHKISIPIHSRYRTSILFPRTPSPFVGLGNGDLSEPKFQIYDLRRPQRAVTSITPNPNVKTVALSPDGKHFATKRRSDPAIRIFSCSTGQRINDFDLPGRYPSVKHLAFADSQRLVVDNSEDKTIEIRDIKTSKVLAAIKLPISIGPHDMALSPGGSYFAIQRDKKIKFYDTHNGHTVGTISISDADSYVSRLDAMSFSPDGTELAIVANGPSSTKRLKCFGLSDGQMVVKHDLKDLPSSYSHSHNLVWFADGSGWYWMGGAVIDRKGGGPLAKEKRSDNPRRYVNHDRILKVVGEREEMKLVLVPHDKDKIADAVKVIAAGGTSADAGLPPLTNTDLSQAKTVSLSDPVTWTYKPHAVSLREYKPVVLEGTSVTIGPCWFSLGHSHLAASSTEHNKVDGKLVFQTPIALYDLSSRKRIARFVPPYKADMAALSASGKVGVFIKDESRDKGRVDLFDLVTSKPVVALRPYASSKEKDVKWAGLAADDTLITLSGDGQIVGWKIPECRPLYKISLKGRPQELVFDAAHRTFVVNSEGQFYLVDAASGSVVGELEVPGQSSATTTTASFRSDGKGLVASLSLTDACKLVEWDLTDGSLKTEMSVPYFCRELTWAGPRHVTLRSSKIVSTQEIESFLSKSRRTRGLPRPNITPELLKRHATRILIDLDQHMAIWSYYLESGRFLSGGPGDRLWYLAGRTTTQLRSLRVPDPIAAKLIGQAKLPEPILGPGGKVSIGLTIRGNFPTSTNESGNKAELLKQELKAHLSGVFQRGEIATDDIADTKLNVEMEEVTSTRTLNLRSRFGRETKTLFVKVTEVSVNIKVLDPQGQTAWSKSRRFGTRELIGLDLNRRPAEMDPATYVRMKQWDNAAEWVRGLRIPLPMHSHQVHNGLGESSLGTGSPQVTRTPKPAAKAKPRSGDKTA